MVSRIDERGFDIARRYSSIDPALFDGIVDSGPSISNLLSVSGILKDWTFLVKLMASAYEGSVYSLGRHRNNDPNALDLPIGAAVGDASNGMFYIGYAQDKELEDPSAHAEVMAIRHFRMLNSGKSLAGLSLATTLEPCPNCLQEIHESGISRVVFGAGRKELEDSEIMRRHGIKAPEIVRSGRSTGLYPFEFFQFPDFAVQDACVEIFASFNRDLTTERVQFDRSFTHSTRYNLYNQAMNESRAPIRIDPERDIRHATESLALYDNFLDVIDGFSGRKDHAPYRED